MNERIWGTLDPFFEPGPILGRKVANTWFLRAFLRADPFDAYHFFPGRGAIGQDTERISRNCTQGSRHGQAGAAGHARGT